MSLFFQRSGILTTLQDLGRSGYQRFGINPTGAIDPVAARLANLLVANDPNSALIETHFPAPEITFEQDIVAAIAGADLDARLNDVPVQNWSTFFARRGSTLKFFSKKLGSRAYLAVRGGFDVESWLGSSSTNLAAGVGGFNGRRMIAGDRLAVRSPGFDPSLLSRRVAPSLLPLYRPFPTVRVVAGAEFDLLDRESTQHFTTQNYIVSSNSNRMGFRLLGDELRLAQKAELLSSAVDRGTVQLLPEGNLIVLMADHQTTGGYPRIAHVISRDIPLIGQLGPGDMLAFHLVGIAHAEALAVEFEREMNLFRIAALARFERNTRP